MARKRINGHFVQAEGTRANKMNEKCDWTSNRRRRRTIKILCSSEEWNVYAGAGFSLFIFLSLHFDSALSSYLGLLLRFVIFCVVVVVVVDVVVWTIVAGVEARFIFIVE